MKRFQSTLGISVMMLCSSPTLLFAKAEVGAVNTLIGDNIVGWIYDILAGIFSGFLGGYFNALFGGHLTADSLLSDYLDTLFGGQFG